MMGETTTTTTQQQQQQQQRQHQSRKTLHKKKAQQQHKTPHTLDNFFVGAWDTIPTLTRKMRYECRDNDTIVDGAVDREVRA